jgi:2-polyprenyl-3-methyl-5-hydroxy-6-metoxy-1,4-benzoquinol methylase
VELVQNVIDELGSFDLAADSDAERAPSQYLNDHRHEYVRTVQDVAGQLQAVETHPARVLEIGSFFGVVSMSLARVGFQVVALDIPEFIQNAEQQQRFSRLGITAGSIRLQDYLLPFDDESFDAVIMCEVLEHLNFNPLPLLKEINRVLKPGGLFYLSLPNGANVRNRLDILRGHPIQVSVGSFFDQLNSRHPEIVNGHWKEYTAGEIREMLTPLGFCIKRQYYFCLSECLDGPTMKNRLGRLLYGLFPSLKENQTTLAVRDRRTPLTFTIPTTVHDTLREL